MKGSIILELILNVSRPQCHTGMTEEENVGGVVVTWHIICITLYRNWPTQLLFLLVYRPILSELTARTIFEDSPVLEIRNMYFHRI
jgi:hypothetical protein